MTRPMEDYYSRIDEVDPFDCVQEETSGEQWWERFYDEGNPLEDYDGCKEEVER